jgi:asparagine synthetase B (glutamine-hydrolysing)
MFPASSGGKWRRARFASASAGENSDARYYSISAVFRDATAHRPIASLVQPPTLLREFVDESARAHLVSDVPVGAFLSDDDGGALGFTCSPVTNCIFPL